MNAMKARGRGPVSESPASQSAAAAAAATWEAGRRRPRGSSRLKPGDAPAESPPETGKFCVLRGRRAVPAL